MSSEFDTLGALINRIKRHINQGENAEAREGLQLMSMFIQDAHEMAHDMAVGRLKVWWKGCTRRMNSLPPTDHFFRAYKRTEVALRYIEKFLGWR